MKSQQLNDLWSAYRYGDRLKVIYFKSGKLHSSVKKSQWEKLKADREFVKLQSEIDERYSQSVSRSRNTIFEIAMCNPFEWFVTLTLDKEKRDRYDLKAFRKDFSQFVRDQNKKRSDTQKIEYLLIPEQHDDGAWHMHGLFMGLTDSDLVKNEHGYLDWFAYRKRFGFFSCSRIKSHEACSKYITKYVTKDIKKRTALDSFSHTFYASKGLKRREVICKLSADRCPFIKDDRWDFENDYIKVAWYDI